MESKFLEAVQKRRSFRVITNQSTLTQNEIIEIARNAIEHTPTAFNSQSPRIALLFDQKHIDYWQKIIEYVKQTQSREQFEKNNAKLQGYLQAYGTVLFFEDMSIHEKLKEKYPKLATDVEQWANQGQGMIQYIMWTALTEQGMGASLQHYLINNHETILDEFQIESKWKLYAQMPFGIPIEEPREKSIVEINERLNIIR